MFPSPIVLGSGSPRRKELLQMAEVDFRVLVSDVNEDFSDDIPAEEIPEMLAIRKAKAIRDQFDVTNEWILTADTIVLLDGEVINKPSDAEDACRMLSKLSGNKHQVITGVCLLKGEVQLVFNDRTDVYFNDLSSEEIQRYVDRYQPFDKAGAYAIQEWIGLVGVRRIDGCFYNVMGLPVPKLSREVKSLQHLFQQ